MKNNILKGLTGTMLLVGGIMLSSCGSDFLDTTPSYKVSTENVWTSQNMANAVVNGAYERFYWEHIGDMGRYKWDNWCELMDEDVNWTGDCALKMGTATASSDIFSNVWKMTYEEIYRTSNVIVNIDKVPDMTAEIKARDKAECQVLRAWAYYRANCFYHGIPIYTEPVEYGKIDKARASMDEVWEQIINDCSDAIKCDALPGKYEVTDGNYGRVTKGAAYFIRGQVYLWKKEWAKAEADFKALGTLGYKLFKADNTADEDKAYGYNLSYKKLFKEANEKNDEFIFQYQYTSDSGLGNQYSATYGCRVTVGYAWNNHLPNPYFIESYQWADGRDFNWDDVIPGYSSMDAKARSVYFLRDGLDPNDTQGLYGQAKAKYDQMNSYGSDMSKYLKSGNEARIKKAYDGRDPRLLMSVITPYSKYTGGCLGYAQDYTLRWPYIGADAAEPYDVRTDTNDRYYYLIRKWVHEGREYTEWGNSPIDIPQFRYAEALIGLAEAQNEQGNWQAAMNTLNEVRERAGVAKYNSDEYKGTPVSGVDDMRNRIHNEYKWELAFENKVYFHELRWDYNKMPHNAWSEPTFKGGNGMTEMWGTHRYTLNCPGDVSEDWYKTWAIPNAEVQRFPELLPQNDGWK